MGAQEKLLKIRKNNKTFKSLSFPTISGSGPNGAIIHYKANIKTNRVLKKITPNQNYWLITYDQGKVKPDKMLAMLKADESIMEAEFNKETSTRGDR